jgi:hypothetical protein
MGMAISATLVSCGWRHSKTEAVIDEAITRLTRYFA